MRSEIVSAQDLIAHFQKRCVERVGYLITQKFLREERNAKRLRFIGRQSKKRSFFKLDRKYSEDLVVVFDEPSNVFVTVMYYTKWMQEHPKFNKGCKFS